MPYLVGIPTLSRYDLLAHCLDAVQASVVQPARIMVIDNGGKYIDREGVDVYRPGYNLGVARSWNVLCREAFSEELEPLLLNDDVVIGPDCLAAMQERPEPIVLAPWFQCFTISKQAWDTIGPFDEEFYPAYCEDTDYLYRAKLAGVAVGVVEHQTEHGNGSATVNSMTPQEKTRFLRDWWSWRYYRAKWGGEPKYEKFTQPFDGKPYESAGAIP